MKSTLWKLANGKLLTNEKRKRRHMTDDDLCPRCTLYPKILMHILRDCEAVHESSSMWMDLIGLESADLVVAAF